MSDSWKITSNLHEFNRAIGDYVDHFQVNMCTTVRASSLNIMAEIDSNTPRRTGRAAAAWLPFVWSEGRKTKLKAGKGVNPGESMKAQREGLRLGKYKKNLKDTPKPYAWIQNRVPYVTYLEYGVRKGSQKKKSKGTATFSPVAKSGTIGFVKKAVEIERKAMLKAIRENVKVGAKK